MAADSMRRRLNAINREYHVSVFGYQVYQAKPETAQEWRGLPSQSDVFLVEPDKLDIKTYLRGFQFIMHD